MALVKCRHCGTEVASDAKACTRCASPTFRPGWTKNPTANGVLGLLIFIGIGFCFVKACGQIGKTDETARERTPTSYVLPKGPWTGAAPWVADLQALLKNPKAIKPFSTTRDEDATITIYDLGKLEPRANGNLLRIDGKAKAWRWQLAAARVAPTDIASADHLEYLVEFKDGTVWYAVKEGAFVGHYVSIKPKYLPPQKLLTLETAEYASSENEDGLQPWLCQNGRVAGAKSLDADAMTSQCRSLVRQNLKAPSTAKFDYADDERVLFYGNCDQSWESSVEAQNAFGVPLRITFSCKYDARTQQVRVKLRE